jgi:hypothetical protein
VLSKDVAGRSMKIAHPSRASMKRRVAIQEALKVIKTRPPMKVMR